MATPIYNVPLLATSSSERTVINTSISLGEVLHSSVDAFLLNTPPTTPTNGYKAIVGTTPTGAWASFPNHIAIYLDGWYFYPPSTKYGVQNDKITSTTFYKYNGTTWEPLTLTGGSGGGHIIQDETTDLAAQPRLAFEGAGVTATNTAGRTIVTIPGGIATMLTANTTLYVSPAGSDANNGLSVSTPFLTIGKAISTALTYNTAGFTLTIKLGDGTYNEAILLDSPVGGGSLVFTGNVTTPSNVVIASPQEGVTVVGPRKWDINGIKITPLNIGLFIKQYSSCSFGNIEFGSCSFAHILAFGGSAVQNAPITISGSSGAFGACLLHGSISLSTTITFVASVNYASATIFMDRGLGYVEAFAVSFVNASSVTGKRFIVNNNSVLFINGNDPNTFIPGSTSGTTQNGGFAG